MQLSLSFKAMPPQLDSTAAPVAPLTTTGSLAVPPDPLARQAALIVAEDDHLRRSDSPVANSPSKHPGTIGAASVSSPVRIAPTPMPPAAPSPLVGRRDAVDAGAPLTAQQPAGQAAAALKDGQQAPTDSITLGQLKGITAAFPRPKVRAGRVVVAFSTVTRMLLTLRALLAICVHLSITAT